MPSEKHRNKFSEVLYRNMQSSSSSSPPRSLINDSLQMFRICPLLVTLILNGCKSGNEDAPQPATTTVSPTSTVAPAVTFPALYDPLLTSVIVQPLRSPWKVDIGADFNAEINALAQQYRDHYSTSPDRMIYGLSITAVIENWLVRFDLCTVSKTTDGGFVIDYASAATAMSDKIPDALSIMSRDWGRLTPEFQGFVESNFTSIVDAINYRLGLSPEKLIGLRVFSASGTALGLSFEPYFYFVQTEII